MVIAPMLDPNGKLPYCKGCGHGLVLRALGRALDQSGLAPSDVAIVTDIGCVGLADAQFIGPHTIHTTHGRSTAFATGMSLADSVIGAGRLKPVVLIGDGGAMLGVNHLVNAALLNPDVTVLVHNNFLFGMTGGQNSAFSPLDFITATTREGNVVPPLDLMKVLLASRASFVARKLATDKDLADVIGTAIAHPGFAVVEVMELCPAWAVRWNEITGAELLAIAKRAEYDLGVLREEPRPIYGNAVLGRRTKTEAVPAEHREPTAVASAPGDRGPSTAIGIVIAGSAGEHVQSSATLLAKAAMSCGLHATQKNDNPVTQGTGFSVSEVILSPEPILFTGIERSDVVIVVSADGVRELTANGAWSRTGPETVVLADAELELPDLACTVRRHSFRKNAKLAATAAIAAWLERSGAIPVDAFWAAAEAAFPTQAAGMRESVAHLLSR